MKIQLNQEELETAVKDYVRTMGFSGKVDTINFTATRSNGIETDVEIGQLHSVEVTTSSSTESATNTQPASTAKKAKTEKPKAETKPVDKKSAPVEDAVNDSPDDAVPKKEEDENESLFG